MLHGSSGQVLSRVFEALANERRRAVADWRVDCLARRAALALGVSAPDAADVRRWLVAARTRGELRPVAGADGVCEAPRPPAAMRIP